MNRSAYHLFLAIPALLIVLLTGLPGRATEPSALPPAEIADRLQDAYEKLKSLKADFVQRSTIKMTRRQRFGAGTMIMVKPGRMRWDYQSPERQILISDGTTITMYFAKNNQMIISSAKEYLQSDVTYSFFMGQGDIKRDFVISDGRDEPDGPTSYDLKLIPRKPHPQISRILLRLNRDSFLIEEMKLVDHFDTETKLTFTNLQKDTKAITENSDLFTFTPPPSTEIIRQ